MSVFKLMATTLGVATVALATYCAWQAAAEAADKEDATAAEKLAAGSVRRWPAQPCWAVPLTVCWVGSFPADLYGILVYNITPDGRRSQSAVFLCAIHKSVTHYFYP